MYCKRGPKEATQIDTEKNNSPPYKRTQTTRKAQKNPLPYRIHTHSIKSIKVEDPFFIYNLVSDQSKYTKEIFDFWMDSTPSSKAIEFLVFQITQNKHNGPKSHATFLFLPTKEPLQPIRVSFTERGKTQETPKKERSKVHTSLKWI